MNFQQLFDQVIGSGSSANAPDNQQAASSPLDSIKSAIPGGLAGGAAAGGIMALLMGNKSARKIAGKAATFGSTALLGGLAYKAYQNWEGNQSPQHAQPISTQDIEYAQTVITPQTESTQPALHLTLIKSMIAAAKADGQIDMAEQQHIFDAVEKMQLGADEKATVFDSMNQDISVEDLANSVSSVAHKAEVYLAGYLAIDPDHPDEQAYLKKLAQALSLPATFIHHLEQQAQAGVQSAPQY